MIKALSVDHYFETLPQRFQPAHATGVKAVFQFEISGEGARTTHAIVDGANLQVIDGQHESPTVVLCASGPDWINLVNGKMHGGMAYIRGRLKIRGDLALAHSMRKFFPRYKVHFSEFIAGEG